MKTIFNDPALRRVQWKDLTRLSLREIFIENTITLPWLILSLFFAAQHWYWLAVPCSFLFFLTALRHVHNAFHYALGLSKRNTDLLLYIYSMLMFSSINAVKYNHLRHHKYCLQDGDAEGACARMNGFKALLLGPYFIVNHHVTALRSGKKAMRRSVLTDLLLMAIFAAVAFVTRSEIFVYHIIVMTAGEFLSAFFAVWTVHHDCDEYMFARTQRRQWKNFFTYNMFYHLEHHLFPAVPTIKLSELARRIDEQLPGLKKRLVF
jgi:fatty acid desaturase